MHTEENRRKGLLSIPSKLCLTGTSIYTGRSVGGTVWYRFGTVPNGSVPYQTGVYRLGIGTQFFISFKTVLSFFLLIILCTDFKACTDPISGRYGTVRYEPNPPVWVGSANHYSENLKVPLDPYQDEKIKQEMRIDLGF